MQIFPNPASAKQPLTITFDGVIQGPVQFDLHKACGTHVKCWKLNIYPACDTIQLSLKNIPRGIYTLCLHYAGKVGSQRLLIR